jgi:hypothetical protein
MANVDWSSPENRVHDEASDLDLDPWREHPEIKKYIADPDNNDT